MDQNIRPIKFKPRVRLVPAASSNCVGCANHPRKMRCESIDVMCTSSSRGEYYHIKVVGEHPSTS